MRLALRIAARMALMAGAIFATAQEQLPNSIPLAWFDGPEQHAKHWKVQIGPAFLAYNQRWVIPTGAVFPLPKDADARHTDLYIIVRIANEKGEWLPGADRSHIQLAALPKKDQSVDWGTAILVRPGRYHVVVLAYDRRSGEHFLWRKLVEVAKPDILPDLDRNMPEVEFIDPNRRHAPVGEDLPIRNQQPLRIDVVLNLTGDMQMNVNPAYYQRFRQATVETALVGSASVLSQLRPSAGCVRVSAIDILHLEVIRDRGVADPQVEWQKVRETIRKNRDAVTVDVRTLEGRKKAREFFRHFLEQVLADNSGCGPDVGDPARAVIVVSDSVMFPPNSDSEHVAPPVQKNERFYHVKITSRNVPTYDQVGHMLGSLHPKQFDVTAPIELRKALAAMMEELALPLPQRAGAH